jgi:hypothetical protein
MSSERTEGQPQEGQKKVAIVGFAESWKLAPWDDPSIECWCLNEFWKYAPRWNRWFELHDGDTLGVSKRDALPEGEQKRHLDWLSRNHGEGKPIYMQPQYCDGRYPNAVPYPLDRMVSMFGRYFTSSIGYMTALAIADGYDWIGLYGIDLASDIEYQQQRANAEYFVGYAKGMGKTVVLAETSAICKAGHLYGFDKPLVEGNQILSAVKAHKAGLQKKHHETLATLNTLDGAIQEAENLIKLHEYKERGVHLETY